MKMYVVMYVFMYVLMWSCMSHDDDDDKKKKKKQIQASRAMRKCVMSYANNKGADEPAHSRSLISAFVVRCLDSIISLDSTTEISRLLPPILIRVFAVRLMDS